MVELSLESDSILNNVYWSTGDYTSFTQTKDEGIVKVYFEDEHGCKYSDVVKVNHTRCEPCPVFVPTAFTIDHNGLNETFRPVADCQFERYHFTIYNRWGELIYETFDSNASWDGSYKGEDVQQDVYVWLVHYVDATSLQTITLNGTVTVLR
jgi:gliding motility-associated-like protein